MSHISGHNFKNSDPKVIRFRVDLKFISANLKSESGCPSAKSAKTLIRSDPIYPDHDRFISPDSCQDHSFCG